jgi:hypothetical protein
VSLDVLKLKLKDFTAGFDKGGVIKEKELGSQVLPGATGRTELLFRENGRTGSRVVSFWWRIRSLVLDILGLRCSSLSIWRQ